MNEPPKNPGLSFTGGSNATDVVRRADASVELTIRLWGPSSIKDGRRWLSWNCDSAPIHLISDLLVACDAVLLPDTPDRLVAQFDSPQQAVAAAKRIQFALLGFFQDQPTLPVAAAIAVDTSAGEPSHPGNSPLAASALSALGVAKPAQILVAEIIYQQLNGVPGLEFRNFAGGGGVRELVWAPPDTYGVLGQALSNQLLDAPIRPAQDPMSATRLLQLPIRPAAPDAVAVASSDNSYWPSSETTNTDAPEAFAGDSNSHSIHVHTSRVRRALLATAGIVAILVLAVIWVSVDKSAPESKTQKVETIKRPMGAPAVQSSEPVSPVPDGSLTHSAAADTSANHAPDEPKPIEPRDDSSSGRRGQRKAVAARTTTSEPAAKKSAGKATGNCQLQDNEISTYLDIADRNRAGGNYDDALREYSAVIECDRHNARAQKGLVRTKQARAVSDGNPAEDTR